MTLAAMALYADGLEKAFGHRPVIFYTIIISVIGYFQYFTDAWVLTADRSRIQRLVTVDLTTGTIASSKVQPAPTPRQEAAICSQELGA